jgi:HD superfamily phosphohydrolase
MNKWKIFNDPVYGFITIPHGILYDIVQEPVFQRLRRIGQVGMTYLTYPGANHTRFHHALGALHLTTLALNVLESKGTLINKEEKEAVCIAVLLHDLGHGPFSHSLEGILIDTNHESLSLHLMEELNIKYSGRLDMAISIFQDKYPKKFLHALVSGQLDMDRMDYLNRDSFYTGVMEGKIGFDRIIKMLQIVNDQLVIEEKGIYSIEKFLVARKIMYWQVYLHKAVLSAELMLVAAVNRAKDIFLQGSGRLISEPLKILFEKSWSDNHNRAALLEAFIQIDDHDIMMLLKENVHSNDFKLQLLSSGLIHRHLFRLVYQKEPFSQEYIKKTEKQIANYYTISSEFANKLIWRGKEQTTMYDSMQNEIHILEKSGDIVPLSKFAGSDYIIQDTIQYYLCFPKMDKLQVAGTNT